MTGLRNTLQKDMLKILITSLWASLITKSTRLYRHEKAMFILVLLLMIPFFTHALEVEEPKNPLKITLSPTYVTQHYWRGIGRGKLFGEAPAFEPQITFAKGKWMFGLFAGASFDNIYKTAMPFVIYQVTPEFSVAVQDIYSPGAKFWDTNPFDFNLKSSYHFVDYYMTYRFRNFPLQLKWATVFLGKDPKPEGGRNFTSYAEIGYGVKYKKWQADAFIGTTPWKGLYATKAGINNLELKVQHNFVINQNVPFPVFLKAGYNPIAEKGVIVAGATVNLRIK